MPAKKNHQCKHQPHTRARMGGLQEIRKGFGSREHTNWNRRWYYQQDTTTKWNSGQTKGWCINAGIRNAGSTSRSTTSSRDFSDVNTAAALHWIGPLHPLHTSHGTQRYVRCERVWGKGHWCGSHCNSSKLFGEDAASWRPVVRLFMTSGSKVMGFWKLWSVETAV